MSLIFSTTFIKKRGDILEKWIAEAVGLMHINKITNSDIAAKLDVTPEYVSMILNGKKTPTNAEERILNAIQEICNNNPRK